MATCNECDGTFDVEELIRHRNGPYVVVHCPDCKHTMGTWRDPARRTE